MGKFLEGFRNRRNASSETEGGYRDCIDCGSASLASDGLTQLPGAEGVLATGMRRTLANLYGNCAAAYSLNSIDDSHDSSIQHSRYNLASSSSDPDRSKLHIPGIPASTVNNGFDNVRSVNPKASPLGPYEAISKGGRTCRGSVDVNGELVDPSKVHKMFGNGAAGRMVGSEFNSFSCGSQSYLNQQTDVQRAFRCGLHPDSAPAIALDCTELIGASAVETCQKLHPNQTIGSDGIRLGGSLLSTSSLAPNACLKQPQVSVIAPVNSGDMFVIEGHSIMITDVGNDPFGISRANGNCRGITSQSFTFSFAQSSSFKEMGPVQSTAKAYDYMVQSNGYPADHFPLNHIVQMARKMCEDSKRGVLAGPSSNYLRGAGVRQLRHNTQNPSCSYPPGQCPKSAGSECARSCGV